MCDWRHRRGLGTMAGNSQIMPSIGPEHWTFLAALQFTSKISLSSLFTYVNGNKNEIFKPLIWKMQIFRLRLFGTLNKKIG